MTEVEKNDWTKNCLLRNVDWTLLGLFEFGRAVLRHSNCATLRTCILRFADFYKIVDNDFVASTCKDPCTYFSFETSLLYTYTLDHNENIARIVFDNTVYVTKTSFLLSIPSLLTGLGGAISGGRTLLWFITSALGIFKLVEKFKYCNFFA